MWKLQYMLTRESQCWEVFLWPLLQNIIQLVVKYISWTKIEETLNFEVITWHQSMCTYFKMFVNVHIAYYLFSPLFTTPNNYAVYISVPNRDGYKHLLYCHSSFRYETQQHHKTHHCNPVLFFQIQKCFTWIPHSGYWRN